MSVSTLKQRLCRSRLKIGALAVFTLKQAKHEHMLKLIENYTHKSKGVIHFSPFVRANRLRQNCPKRSANTKTRVFSLPMSLSPFCFSPCFKGEARCRFGQITASPLKQREQTTHESITDQTPLSSACRAKLDPCTRPGSPNLVGPRPRGGPTLTDTICHPSRELFITS